MTEEGGWGGKVICGSDVLDAVCMPYFVTLVTRWYSAADVRLLMCVRNGSGLT